MLRRLGLWIGALALLMAVAAAPAGAEPTRVLWWSAPYFQERDVAPRYRKQMADYLDGVGGGAVFDVTWRHGRSGELAQLLAQGPWDVLVLDLTDPGRPLNSADLTALRSFYASGRRALMLDGTLNIRSTGWQAETRFPGRNESSAGLLLNQIRSLEAAGGGILIGTDHGRFQRAANQALEALLPGAAFSGITNPSTDGAFLGRALLAQAVEVTPRDLFRHWESVPNQGEAPVGTFTDTTGQPVTLHALVSAADKPGGGKQRPFISATLEPDASRTALDAAAPAGPPMPTRQGPPG